MAPCIYCRREEALGAFICILQVGFWDKEEKQECVRKKI